MGVLVGVLSIIAGIISIISILANYQTQAHLVKCAYIDALTKFYRMFFKTETRVDNSPKSSPIQQNLIIGTFKVSSSLD